VNARLSERSYKRWRKNKATARTLFSRFQLIMAQNERLARRFRELGGRNVMVAGNLKVDAPPLPVDQDALALLRLQIGTRPVFLAASTHPGEDEIVIEAVTSVRQLIPDLLTILAPRHPDRGPAIVNICEAAGLKTVRRQNTSDTLSQDTDIYVADTVGEMGLLYSLAQVAFVGGSLVERGGQNPIEAIRFSTAVLTGPSQYNFADAYGELKRRNGIVEVHSVSDLASIITTLLTDDDQRSSILKNAAAGLAAMQGALRATSIALQQLLPPPVKGSQPGEGMKRAS
jgi:3-deoxy-D-manno-octulosonic-acid transferase